MKENGNVFISLAIFQILIMLKYLLKIHFKIVTFFYFKSVILIIKN